MRPVTVLHILRNCRQRYGMQRMRSVYILKKKNSQNSLRWAAQVRFQKEKEEIQYDIFSGFLAELRETEELPVDFKEKLFHKLVDYATIYPDGRAVFTFRNGGKLGRRFKAGSGRNIGFIPDASGRFFCVEIFSFQNQEETFWAFFNPLLYYAV